MHSIEMNWMFTWKFTFVQKEKSCIKLFFLATYWKHFFFFKSNVSSLSAHALAKGWNLMLILVKVHSTAELPPF